MAGIYIHIPFCKKLCHYCDFYHVVSDEQDHKDFISALLEEAELKQNYLGKGTPIYTIYIGGGTPSVFSVKEIETILNNLINYYSVEKDCEITIEVNPDDVSPEYMKGLKNIEINRVSLGIQSWHDDDLKLLNRRHTAEEAAKALNDIINAGFENISADLIYGIPGMNTERWASNIDRTLAFDIQHLSAYHLTIEPGTVFGKMLEKGKLQEAEEEESVSEFNLLLDKMETAGFIQYEISNFGRPGYFSAHNTNYWKQVPYIGLGPSAHSFNGYSRQWNVKNLKKYIRYVKGGRLFYEKEDLDLKTKFNEYILTSLRTMWGIDLEYVEKAFEKEGYDYVVNFSAKFINYGLMEQKEKSLILTNQGKMISDNIISEFMMPAKDN